MVGQCYLENVTITSVLILFQKTGAGSPDFRKPVTTRK